jgi:hypothetical protein
VNEGVVREERVWATTVEARSAAMAGAMAGTGDAAGGRPGVIGRFGLCHRCSAETA